MVQADVVVGVGARAGTSAAEVLAAVDAVLPPGARVTALVTLDRRAAEPGMRAASESRGWALVGLPPDELARVAVPHPSAGVAAAVGTPSVAEAAAVVWGGELVVPKHSHGPVTVAVALARGHFPRKPPGLPGLTRAGSAERAPG